MFKKLIAMLKRFMGAAEVADESPVDVPVVKDPDPVLLAWQYRMEEQVKAMLADEEEPEGPAYTIEDLYQLDYDRFVADRFPENTPEIVKAYEWQRFVRGLDDAFFDDTKFDENTPAWMEAEADRRFVYQSAYGDESDAAKAYDEDGNWHCIEWWSCECCPAARAECFE